MKSSLALIAMSIFLLTTSAHARDDKHMFPIKDAMETEAAKEKLDPGIKFYFGNQSHPKATKKYGNFSTSKKTNAFNKSDDQACQWAFLSALLALQDRAQREGGNAVINIASNYKHKTVKSNTEYECHAGNILAGVALKGDVVKLAQ